MSDETRTVTVEQLARALGQEIHVDSDHGFPETANVHAVAHSIFAALPTSTEGLDEAWDSYKSGHRWAEFLPICRDETSATHWRHDMFAQGWHAARLASLSPSPTETPEPTEEEPT